MNTLKARLLARRDTTEAWNALLDFIPLKGEIIVYTDRFQKDGVDVPGIKIGDGKAFCIDLPFISDETTDELMRRLDLHENNALIHVSEDDRAKWDQTTEYSVSDNETLIIWRE